MKIHPEMKKHFVMFSRNGRWGTCVDCPKDSNGKIYPEFCGNTQRYDHNLTVESLVEQHLIRLPHDAPTQNPESSNKPAGIGS